MTKAGTRSLLSAVLVMLAVAGDRGEAEPYPSGPVKVISDSAPGSAPDAVERFLELGAVDLESFQTPRQAARPTRSCASSRSG